MQIDIQKIADTITKTDNFYVSNSGIKIKKILEGKVILELPITEKHKNHIGTAYALSIIMLMEVGGTTLIRSCYGIDNYEVIIKKIDINFIKPTTKTLVFNMELSEQQANEQIQEIIKRQKGNFPLNIKIQNIDNELIADANFIFYVIKK